MGGKKLLKGPSLAAYARKKAAKLGLDVKGLKLADMVWAIQEQEGHTSCFKRTEKCTQTKCCWQLSCGADMS